jgi:hypothetical protein
MNGCPSSRQEAGDSAMAKQSSARQRPGNAASPAPGDGGLLPLATELNVFEAHLPGWLDREGQHVLIKGEEVVGFFSTRDEALMTGYTRFGIVPFLVKQIAPVEPVYNLPHVEF